MMRHACAALAAMAVGLGGGHASAGPAVTSPAMLTVYATAETTRTVLHLQPGFATVLRADRRIDTVAIGDPRLVTATTVGRDQEVFDLILQPQADAGATNMVVWLGDIATVWDLEIGRGRRTADLVFVVTNAPTAHPEASAPPATPPASAPPPASSSRGTTSERRSGRFGPPQLEIRQAVGAVTGDFQVTKLRDEVSIRYRISNGSRIDLTIPAGGVLVRINGHFVPYAMVRDAVDHQRPDVIPMGATEAGMIDAPSRSPQRVQVIFSLVPAAAPGREAHFTPPITFQAAFAGVDLMETSAL